jgi:hypothetical protein
MPGIHSDLLNVRIPKWIDNLFSFYINRKRNDKKKRKNEEIKKARGRHEQ